MPLALIDLDNETARFSCENGTVVCLEGPTRAHDAARLATRAAHLINVEDPAHLAAVIEDVLTVRVAADDASLMALAGHPDPQVRCQVADCGFASPEVLAELAADDDELVRAAAERAYAAEQSLRESRWMIGIPVVLFVAVAIVFVGLLAALFSMRT